MRNTRGLKCGIRCVAAFGVFFSVIASAQMPDDYCQILDRMEDPVWDVYLGYVDEVAGDDFRQVGFAEAGMGAGLFYAHTPIGDFDLKARLDTVTFTGKGEPKLPEVVGAAVIDLDYILRFYYGNSLRLGFAPGVYTQFSGLDGDHLFYPFRVHGLLAFNPYTSGLLGIDFYPGFDRLIHPRAGIRWAATDFLLFDFFYPESRITLYPIRWLTLRAGIEVRDYFEYQLKNSDERNRMMINEIRIYGGMDIRLTSAFQLMIEGGNAIERSIEFDKHDSKRSLDDAYFVRIGVGGLL